MLGMVKEQQGSQCGRRGMSEGRGIQDEAERFGMAGESAR